MVATLAALGAILIFPAAMLHAAFTDLASMQIRNWLILLLLVSYALLAPLAGFTLQELGSSAAAALGVFLCALVFFVLGWVGGGDAKLISVAMLWLGYDQAFAYVCYSAILGGLLTVALLQFRLWVLPSGWMARPWIARLHSANAGVPYGIALAVAALVLFPNTQWVKMI